jgi:hypothetical protein
MNRTTAEESCELGDSMLSDRPEVVDIRAQRFCKFPVVTPRPV